jgi:hypothetical protein
MNSYPFAEAILSQTNGGLQIIIDYYPGADVCVQNNSKKFRMRSDDKTASSSLKKGKDGTWLVIDWGAWDKPKNAIGVCMFEDNLSFGEACKKLAKLYHIEYKGINHTAKPEILRRPRLDNEKKGGYLFEYKAKISQEELAVIGPKIDNEIAKRFHLKSVVSYSYIKENEVVTTKSTEDYPIFVYDFGKWQKIYQPRSADKSYRFRYAGGRPKDYIFGLDDAINRHEALKKQAAKDANEEEVAKAVKTKLDNLIICSGDRDALNVASFGYNVVWLNSETAGLSSDQYKQLAKLSETIYNLPDIDRTGVQQAVKLGLKYMEIKTIWLPEYLLKTKDWRGNPRKDFLDFVNLKYNKEKPHVFKKMLTKLIENALPMRFWDESKQYDKNGNFKGIKYDYNIVYAEHFLMHQGFYRMENPYNEEDYYYIRIDGNNICKTNPNKIENFVNDFLKDRQMPIELRNMVKKTPYLRETHLSKLPLIDVDFSDCDSTTQYWFFTKNVVEINAYGIKVYKKGIINKMVMEKKVIDFPTSIPERKFIESFAKPQFKIFKDVHGDDDIEIINKKNHFLNYLINASRIHWRKDLEDSFKGKNQDDADAYFKKHQFNIAGPNLNEDEILEQKLHLINKIYAIGYLCHKYKLDSKAWFVFGIDNKLSDIGESHGGSGKSLMYDKLEYIMKDQFYIKGRGKKAADNDFLYDGVTQETDYIYIDDMGQYFPFDDFFTEITGKMKVNPKNAKGYTINYQDSPKLCGTSNFVPRNLDPSSMRRILFTVNSDYYHYNKDDEYLQVRQVRDDFGKDLFRDFTEEEFNDFYVFVAQCIQFYLGCPEKKDPPMNNVTKRNLMAEMGDVFRNWAIVYFSEESSNLDTIVIRKHAYDDYKETAGKNYKTAPKFKKSIKAFCKLNGYVFNPKEIGKTTDGRIVKMFDGKTQECFYIKTSLDAVINDAPTEPNTNYGEAPY